MWLQQLKKTIKARLELTRWLRQQRAERLDLPHLSNHLRADMGLDNPRVPPTKPSREMTQSLPEKEAPDLWQPRATPASYTAIAKKSSA